MSAGLSTLPCSKAQHIHSRADTNQAVAQFKLQLFQEPELDMGDVLSNWSGVQENGPLGSLFSFLTTVLQLRCALFLK